jgi:hypothetical protein
MSVKPFSPALYKQYNNLGINTAIHFLTQMGFSVVNRDEAYKSHDVIMEKNGKQCLVEAEVTEKWTRTAFPYTFMSVPHRKKDSNADYYVRVNAHGNALFFCPMKDVLTAPVITKNTTYTVNEKFFNLPVSGLILYYLEDGVWYADEDSE